MGWPPRCKHELDLGTCADCGGSGDYLDDRYCSCMAEIMAVRQQDRLNGITYDTPPERPPIENGRCSRCGLGFPPSQHDGRHGPKCPICLAQAKGGIKAIRDHDKARRHGLIPDKWAAIKAAYDIVPRRRP